MSIASGERAGSSMRVKETDLDPWQQKQQQALQDTAWNADADGSNGYQSQSGQTWGTSDTYTAQKTQDESSGWGYDNAQQAPQAEGNDGTSWGSWGKQQQEPADAWSSWTGGSTNAWQTNQQPAETAEDANKRRHETYRKEYYDCQKWYKDSGILPDTHNSSCKFLDESGDRGVDFELYNSVEVQVSGDGSESLPKHLDTFEDLFSRFDTVPKQLEENLKLLKFQYPTPVQKYAVIAGLAGRDVMCCAQTGSGKTAAYLIPMLASMMKNHRATGGLKEPFEGPCKPDTLILAPTRELALQIYDDALRFCYGTDYRVVRVYGQEARGNQIRDFSKGADICVATPGRFADYVEAEIISVKETYCLVLDEADRMLELGFEETIRELVEKRGMPGTNERQTMMFSATFPDEIQKIANNYLHRHLFVRVGKIGTPAATVTQVVMQVEKNEKLDKLVALIDQWMQHSRTTGEERMLVFTNSKNQTKALDEFLWDKEVAKTGALHGDLDQPKRESNLALFREGKIDVMLATDVAARGLDISKVSHVVNYDLPKEPAVYVHRIGRTGRIGHRGTALSFVTTEDGWWLDTEEMLRELPTFMERAPNTTVPDWLLEKCKTLTAGSWGSKADDTKDARESWSGWTPTAEGEWAQNQEDTWKDSWEQPQPPDEALLQRNRAPRKVVTLRAQLQSPRSSESEFQVGGDQLPERTDDKSLDALASALQTLHISCTSMAGTVLTELALDASKGLRELREELAARLGLPKPQLALLLPDGRLLKARDHRSLMEIFTCLDSRSDADDPIEC
ncbi:DED1 [Symbiodinium sp. CCMP2456]|nr:DED1 [Symbiodinium sp. CCMP2456]